MLNRKSLIVATAAALTLGAVAIPGQAQANDNGVLGAVVGAGIGAAIGHNHGRNGALVGGAIGAIAGATIAERSSSYYGRGYYAAPADVYATAPGYYGAPDYDPAPAYYAPATTYYAPATTYYEPASVYYSQPWVHYAPRVDYARYYGGHRDDRFRSDDHGHHDWRGGDHRHGR